MNVRLAALWVLATILIAGGFVTSWLSAVVAADRYSHFTSGSMVEPDFNWIYLLSNVSLPLLCAGFAAVLITLAVHAILWRTTPPAPSR